MHAERIVQCFIETHLPLIHAARRRVFGAVIAAAMSGHWLSVSRLGRGVLGSGSLKAAIKRVDRLIGHTRIADEARSVGAALIERLCRMATPLVIAIDWSAVSPGGTFVELRAAVTWLGMGRGLTIYQQVYPRSMLSNRKAEFALLDTLRSWIAADTEVIVITDAGFRRPWFAYVERLGWSWIGRVRRGMCMSHDRRRWAKASTWFVKATRKAERWSDCWLTKYTAWPCDLVLYRRAKRGGKRYRCPGYGSTPKATKEAKISAREPWLLAHSARLRQYRADEIVAMYGRRMQIEENFRDSKSTMLGMGFEIGRSRSALRLHALLLIATLAAFVLWHIGQLAEAEGLHRRYKATTRKARELSIITLAILLCTLPHLPLTPEAKYILDRRLGLR